MNILATLITNSQASKLMQPGQRPFDHPAIEPQAAAVSGSPPGQHRFDPHLAQGPAMRLGIIPTVAVQRVKTKTGTAGPSRHGGNGVDQWQQSGYIVPVGTGQLDDEGKPVAVGEHVMFRPQFPSIRRIRAGFRPPKTARTDAESTTAREKSIWPAPRSLFNSTWWIFSQVPCCFQACSRRQQLIPEPQPISWGRYSHGIPVRRTNKIPVRACRFGIAGRPPLGLGLSGGNNGSMNSHNASETSGLAMTLSSMTIGDILYSLISVHRSNHTQTSRFC